MSTKFINLSGQTHKKRDSSVEYVGRPTPLGNPFTAKQHGRTEALAKYRTWLDLQWRHGNTKVIAELERLAEIERNGILTLACWCHPKPCHSHIIGEAITAINNRRNNDESK